MARNAGTVVSNNFSRGVITEATGMNFPENAVTDALNFIFDKIGSVHRRLGIDIEGGVTTLPYDSNAGVVKEFVWQSVARSGTITFLVLQTGYLVYFYRLEEGSVISFDVTPPSIDLRDFSAGGSLIIDEHACSFTQGAGYLFIAHPVLETIMVRWNDDASQLQKAAVALKIRDFEGLDDGLSNSENPSSLSNPHYYNLRNQGWFQDVRIGSVSNEIGSESSDQSVSLTLSWSAL
jgi:hypothetical protein